MAVPRLSGSAALPEIEESLASLLGAWGFEVTRHTFPTSPARLTAVSVAGAGLGWVALLGVPLTATPVSGGIVAAVGIAAMALTALVAFGIAERHLSVPQPTVQAVNLDARRGRPRVWLVAHSDSKAQSCSLRGRVVAAVLAAVGAVGLLGVFTVHAVRPVPLVVSAPIGLIALAGAAVLSRSGARNDSPGAVDNASGAIAVLDAARRLADRSDVGVLITGAEEFGMEGARAWIASGGRGEWFVNVDGVDGRGGHRVMVHGRPSTLGDEVGDRLVTVLRAMGHTATLAALPPGVLVDGVILAGAGMAGVTLSRGDWATLGVVHTKRDTPERLDLDAALAAGEAIATATRDLLS